MNERDSRVCAHMVTMEQFHKELREKLGGDVSPNENCCPHYRYYLPSDAECPYETHPQRLFWMCERDFHRIYGCHDGCRSYLDLWAECEANQDWIGPEQYVDEPVADRLLAFWLMGDYNQYCPDGEFDLKAYFTLYNRGGRSCQERMNTSVEATQKMPQINAACERIRKDLNIWCAKQAWLNL